MNGEVQYLTENEVSRITRRALKTLRNDRHKRRGIQYVKVGRSVLYKLTDVAEFMDSRRIETEGL